MKRFWLIVGLAVLLFVFAFLMLRKKPVPQHPWFEQFTGAPLVISHADDTGLGLWPGNTMAYLDGVAELGVDVLEMDVHMTADGHIVLMHDSTVDRTTNGNGAISNMTLGEVKALEVGVNWTQDAGATYPYRGQGLRVPALAEVFEKYPDYPMVIEIKQETPSMDLPFCALIRAHGMSERVLIPSFSDQAMNQFRTACPEVATAASTSEVRNFVIANFLLASNALSPDYQAFQVPEESGGVPVVIPHFVNGAHNRNLQVHVWTVNDPAEMRKFLSMGVDGILTDRPDLLLRELERQPN